MDERMNKNNALPADVPAAETCAESAPQGAKKYVKPAMKVFKLDCGLLAASGVSEPPVQVSLHPVGIEFYVLLWDCTHPTGGTANVLYDGTAHSCNEFVSGEKEGWSFGCSDLGGDFLSKYAASVADLRDYADSRTDCSIMSGELFGGQWLCGPGIIDTPGPIPLASFSGADWDVQDFFANAQFDACSESGTFSGTYDGRRFEGEISDTKTITT